MARLEAISPFFTSAGISTIKAGSSAGSGRVPPARQQPWRLRSAERVPYPAQPAGGGEERAYNRVNGPG